MGAALRCSSVHAALSYAKREVVQPRPTHLRWFSYSMNVNFTPAASGLLFAADEAARCAFSWYSDCFFGGTSGRISTGDCGVSVSVKWSPVTIVQNLRMLADLHRIALDTLAGRECQVKNIVPVTSAIRFVVIIAIGCSVKRIHTGVTSKIRIKSVVRAGRVVADVAVRCVERKSVSSSRGSSRTLHLDVNIFRVSTISSKVF